MSVGAGGGPDSRDCNLGYWLSNACTTFPDRVALIDLSRPIPREVTYAELDERMDRVANLLSDAGIGVGDRVALSVGNRFEFVEIMFGAMRCGAVPVPLNYKLARQSLTHIVADAGCRAAFVENRGLGTLGGGRRAVGYREEVAGRRHRRGPGAGKHRLGRLRRCACDSLPGLRDPPFSARITPLSSRTPPARPESRRGWSCPTRGSSGGCGA